MVVVVAGTCGECVSGSWYGGCGTLTDTHTHTGGMGGKDWRRRWRKGVAANKKRQQRESRGVQEGPGGEERVGGGCAKNTQERDQHRYIFVFILSPNIYTALQAAAETRWLIMEQAPPAVSGHLQGSTGVKWDRKIHMWI